MICARIGGWLLLVVGWGATSAAAERPNVLFLFADDMRADAIGAYGSQEASTPHLDRLAAGGVTFTRAHILGGNSGAVCVPSRAMLLSGEPYFRITNDLRGVGTWPMRLREVGYTTHMTGKWHNGAPAAAASFPKARRVFLGGMTDQFHAKLVDFDAAGKPQPVPPSDKHASEIFADEAIRFLKSAPKTPWALYVPFTAPHDPRAAPPEYHARFDPAKMPVPANFLPEHPFDNGELKVRDEQLEAWPRTRAAIQRHWADYHAILAHLDAQIGRILKTVEESGQAGNTIVIFAGDNGLALGSHGLLGKQNVYEHSVRVPLIVGGPGIPAGKRLDALCYLFDLAPTICEWAGAKPPGGGAVGGRSLAPMLNGTRTTHREWMLYAYLNVQRAVSDGHWKAIWYPAIDRWQLFDLESDPHETRDLAGDQAHAARLTALQAKLAALRSEFGDAAKLPAAKPAK